MLFGEQRLRPGALVEAVQARLTMVEIHLKRMDFKKATAMLESLKITLPAALEAARMSAKRPTVEEMSRAKNRGQLEDLIRHDPVMFAIYNMGKQMGGRDERRMQAQQTPDGEEPYRWV